MLDRHGAPERRLVLIVPNVLFITPEWNEHGSAKATARNNSHQGVSHFKILLITEVEVMEAL